MLSTGDDLAALIARVARGDRAAFGTVYQATRLKLYGIALRILRRHDLAEEVLQDVYVKVWERASTFDANKASAITWLATMARNRAIDEVRRTKARPAADEDAAAAVADPAPLALAALEARESDGRLADCLEQLEPDRSEMIKLAYLDGLSREELAERYGHPVPTIKTWLRRGLLQLKDCMSS
jgi:RNA polymerase sigma-70 factor (ECF subfamily)